MSEPASGSRPPARARVVALGAIAVVLVLAALVATFARRHHRGVVAPLAHRDGGGFVPPTQPPALLDAEPGGVHLTGFVVDGAGLPVAGAEVSAEPERGVADRALAGSAAPRDGGGVDAGAAAAAVAVAATTGTDGRFVIGGLEPGRYRLHVTGAGLLAAEVRYVPVPSDAARIVVARQIAIDGTVTDGGRPVIGATVGIRGDAIGGTLDVKTDATGAFHAPKLPEGRYQVYAYQAATAARTVRVSRLGAGPFPPVELRLEAATIVVGRVIDREEGTGLVAAIELRPSGDDQAPRYARSGEDGAFKIEGVPNGRWIADAFAPGYVSSGGVELDAGHGIPELALVRGGGVEGRVIDSEGKPIAGAAVRAMVVGGGGAGSAAGGAIEVSEQVDLDRLRRFSGRTAAPAPTGAPGADPELVARGELGVMIGPIPPLPPPGAEVARAASVVDATSGLVGDPPPLAVDPARASIWVTGADGRYRIRGLAGKGKVTVLAAAAGFAEARSKPASVGAGELVTGVDVILSAGTYVVGKVTDAHGAPVIGAELAATPEVGAPLEGFSDADGLYRLGPLTGAIELRATAYGHVEARRKLTLEPVRGAVPAERHEDLVLDVADAILAGTLDDATGATVAGAHLEVIGGPADGRSAVVGADGTFTLEQLPRGPLRVLVDHPAYPQQELEAEATPLGTRVRLRLALGGAVEGVVLDGSSGAPVQSLVLGAVGPGGATAEASTDARGLWKLGPVKPGHWKIAVRQPGYLPADRELDVPVSHAPGATSVRDVRIDLARGALVGGTVRDARGSRAAGAHVVVKPANADGPTAEGDTDDAGEFRIHDVPTGEVSILATRGDAGGSIRVTVRPGDEVLTLSLEIR